MGQYFMIINETKKEYLHPSDFGDGPKLMEFAQSGGGTLTGLTLLLRQSAEQSDFGGDYHGDANNKMLGHWAGDQISVTGDGDTSGLYQEAQGGYENVSIPTLVMMASDRFLVDDLRSRMKWVIQTLPIQQRKVLLRALNLPDVSGV